MKQILVCFGIMVGCAFQTNPKKTYKVELTAEEWSAKLGHLEYIANALRKSDLPSKEVALITDSAITPLANEITRQVNYQMNLEKAQQQKQDTTKPKKK